MDITHPDKILFPKEKITKKELVEYYKKVALKMLPFLKDRPLVMERYPSGIQGEGFFQKNVQSYFPKWVKTLEVSRKQASKTMLINCSSKDTLLYIANLGCITPHAWLSKKGKLTLPDKMIFDIDPPKGRFDLAKEAAFLLKEVLEKRLHLKTFVMTTGGKGLHVVVPLKPTESFEKVRAFAKLVAAHVCHEAPTLCTTSIRKEGRKRRVYLDVMRNAYAQHAVVPYAVRANEKALVAMPLSWKSLAQAEPEQFTLKTINKHLKNNPWSRFSAGCASLKQARNLLTHLMG
ncbi:MAG: ATP-dependent DNA ligase [Chlamydiae bacterium]|nr:ATP-dependent DNA ligase [Chlamydiota bacterium]